jgi:hypothetical protein
MLMSKACLFNAIVSSPRIYRNSYELLKKYDILITDSGSKHVRFISGKHVALRTCDRVLSKKHSKINFKH